MSSRFYKLAYFTNKKPVNAVINLYAISRIEHCENVVRILFLSSGLVDEPQYLVLTTTTETESAEIYAGIENAMNPVNKQSDETKLA